MPPINDKKGKNSTLNALISQAQSVEQRVINTSATPELPEKEVDELIQEQPEKVNIKEEKIPVEKLPEKSCTGDPNKSSYQDCFEARPKEGLEKMNIAGTVHNKLRTLAMAEGTTMKDLGSNIIEHFLQTYASDVKKSIKKLSD